MAADGANSNNPALIFNNRKNGLDLSLNQISHHDDGKGMIDYFFRVGQQSSQPTPVSLRQAIYNSLKDKAIIIFTPQIETEKHTGENFEMLYPIAKEINLKGLIFFDAGNAWAKGDPYQPGSLRTSVGFGFRWMSPVGPQRIEWGYNLKPKSDEDQSAWDFTIGGFF